MICRCGFKRILAVSLAAVFIFMLFPARLVIGQAGPFDEIQKKLTGISKEEKEKLDDLFTLTQEIELMEGEEKSIARDMEAIKLDINKLEKEIADEETAYEKKKESLKQVLRSYQRMGPGTYLEIILDSDSLTSFLRRVNILRDLTHNTGELLSTLEESRDKLAAEKTKLAAKLALVEEQQKKLDEALAKKKQLAEEQEKYLASLAEEREYYQEYLNGIQKMWDGLKPFFAEATKEFSSILVADNLPGDALKITFTLHGIKGSIGEKTFNDIIAAHSHLTKIEFHFEDGKVDMQVPERNLVLTGRFTALEGHILSFEVDSGSFFGMPLEAGSIKELIGKNALMVDLKPLLGKNELYSIETAEGYLQLTVIPEF